MGIKVALSVGFVTGLNWLRAAAEADQGQARRAAWWLYASVGLAGQASIVG